MPFFNAKPNFMLRFTKKYESLLNVETIKMYIEVSHVCYQVLHMIQNDGSEYPTETTDSDDVRL